MQQWVFSLWSVHGLYSRAATGTVSEWVMARDAIRVDCSSWSRGLQRKRIDSVVVVSYKVYTL
jgi:hypothetical protein